MSQLQYCETNSTQRRWFDVITQTSKLWTRRKTDKQVSDLGYFFEHSMTKVWSILLLQLTRDRYGNGQSLILIGHKQTTS